MKLLVLRFFSKTPLSLIFNELNCIFFSFFTKGVFEKKMKKLENTPKFNFSCSKHPAAGIVETGD